MKKNRWPILLGILLVLLLCCCVAATGVAGFLWWSLAATENSQLLPPITTEPTPALDLELHPPSTTAYETAQIATDSTLPPRNLSDLAQRLQHMPEMLPGENPVVAMTYELGDTKVFWLHDLRANSSFTSTAVLSFETEHAYWWVEEGYGLSDKDLERSAWQFEDNTYPTNHRYFGSEWKPGIDGDPHVYIFLGHVPGVAGYFSGPDEYPAQIRPNSNEHEMFYINLDNAMPGSDYFDGILAHEFQHMIHWAVDRNEATWVNEGLSELAAQVNGYDVGGSDLSFSAAPDTQLTTWSELDDSAPHYGASYLLLAYFLDQYGEQAIRQLVAEQANGIKGFNAVLSDVDPGRHFDDLFADWVIANYLNGTNIADERYSYTDLRIEPPIHANRHDTYPVHEQATVHQYASDYIMLQGMGDLTIEFTGSLVVPLVGNSTHSGEYQWWSNRGDEGDATLTRAFDLGGLEQATLLAWMWYDLEVDFDYAYVEVSADGGQTWNILTNEHTTITNPSGNSYGPALTGRSGGGSEPQWVQETFDLTPYAGQPVLVRFEVITDEALNYPGLCLDDIAIPELGYLYDVEEGDGNWQAAGWVRVGDQVPQDYLVQVIEIGRETRIERIMLDEQMRGRLTVPGLGHELDRAVLVISARAPATTEWTAYSYRITQD